MITKLSVILQIKLNLIISKNPPRLKKFKRIKLFEMNYVSDLCINIVIAVKVLLATYNLIFLLNYKK